MKILAFFLWIIAASILIGLGADLLHSPPANLETAMADIILVFFSILLIKWGKKLWFRNRPTKGTLSNEENDLKGTLANSNQEGKPLPNGIAEKGKPVVAPQANSERSQYIKEGEEIDRTVKTLPIVRPSALILSGGETCHLEKPAALITVKNVVTGHAGRSSGVSVRVAKGLYLRSGGSSGTPIRSNVEEEHPGYICMTNKRIVFVGQKGFSHPLSSLTALIPQGYHEVILQFGKSSYRVKMQNPYWIWKILSLIKGEPQELWSETQD